MTFYSRAPFQLGSFAVRYRFAPVGPLDQAVRGTGPDALTRDLELRLQQGPISWSFDLQGFLDADRTPMADHRIAWRSPWLPIARLTLGASRVPLDSLALRAGSVRSGDIAVLEPLGELNLLRNAAYEVSQAGRE
jgi:hypothetical protein